MTKSDDGINKPSALSHCGDYAEHSIFRTFASMSERAFAHYHELTTNRTDETPTQHLIIRMLYIAEITSTAIRLNSSWVLTHAALSLLRDRYEQVVRFSWLAKQPDNLEMVKFIAAYYGKRISLYQNAPAGQQEIFDKIRGSNESWLKEKPTPDQKAYLNRWNNLDLKSMVEKRDALPPLSTYNIAAQSLADLYISIYAQFSSVSHYDMYSLSMLGLHSAPDGQKVLAADPIFPFMIVLHCALFDLIQCYEALQKYFELDCGEYFTNLLVEWQSETKKVF